jgi:hypothetical protein
MSDRNDDDLVYNESIATGPVRMQLYGDEALAESHMRNARAVLGKMKTAYGVNERMAAGEPGGYFRTQRIMADGTRIEAFTNDGLDSVRITAPVKREVVAPIPEPQGESTDFTPTPVDFEYEPEWPEKSEKKGKPPVLEFTPYLWIGVRIVSGSDPLESDEIKYPQKWAQQLHVCVWEPTPPDEDPVILSNRNDFEPLVTPPLQHLEDKEVYPLQHWKQFIPSDFEDPRKEERANQDFDKPLPTAIAYTDRKLVMIQPDNVYDVEMRVPNYDPRHDPDVKWDIMFISDPDNDLKLADTADPTVTMEADYSGGEYLIKVMCVGPDCHQLAPVEVEIMIIIGKDHEEIRDSKRFTIQEHTNYRMGIMPLGWFKEKQPAPDHPCDECNYRAQDYGPNPHADHWWQGMAVATVPPIQREVSQEEYFPPVISFSKDGVVEYPEPGFFEPAAFHDRAAICPGCNITSVRYFQDAFQTAQIWWEMQPNDACDYNTHVLGDFFDSKHYVTVKKINYEVGGSKPYETMDGYTFSMPEGGDAAPIVDEYTFAWTDGIGGRCVGKDHDPWYADVNYTELGELLFNDTVAFIARMEQHFGGPPERTMAYSSWTITTETYANGDSSGERKSYISLGEFIGGPFNVHNNPDAKGYDICSKSERWTWSVLDIDNLPPNHQK